MTSKQKQICRIAFFCLNWRRRVKGGSSGSQEIVKLADSRRLLGGPLRNDSFVRDRKDKHESWGAASRSGLGPKGGMALWLKLRRS